MRKIAMVGTTPTGAGAPFNDESWEIWGVSQRFKYFTRADRWFEVHRIDGEPEHWQTEWRKSMKEFLNRDGKPVPLYMMYPEPGLTKTVIQYPMERMVDRFGSYFMTSTFSWMMALAIDELRPLKGRKVKGEIGIWGVEMEHGTEYRQQRVGLRHFIDVARVLGIPVHRLVEGGLAYEPIPYPMWQDDPLIAKSMDRHKEAVGHLKKFDETLERVRPAIASTQGALYELDLQGKKNYDREKRRATLEKQYSSLMQESAQTSKDLVSWGAIKGEHDWLQDYLSV